MGPEQAELLDTCLRALLIAVGALATAVAALAKGVQADRRSRRIGEELRRTRGRD